MDGDGFERETGNTGITQNMYTHRDDYSATILMWNSLTVVFSREREVLACFALVATTNNENFPTAQQEQ